MRVQHQPVKASDLRDGDLMRIGSSTNYVLVADAPIVNGKVAVTIYNGETPNDFPTLSFEPGNTVHLSMRNAPAAA